MHLPVLIAVRRLEGDAEVDAQRTDGRSVTQAEAGAVTEAAEREVEAPAAQLAAVDEDGGADLLRR